MTRLGKPTAVNMLDAELGAVQFGNGVKNQQLFDQFEAAQKEHTFVDIEVDVLGADRSVMPKEALKGTMVVLPDEGAATRKFIRDSLGNPVVINQFPNIKDVMAAMGDRDELAYPNFMHVPEGGFKPGELIAYVSSMPQLRPSELKSNFRMNMALRALQAGETIGIVSHEPPSVDFNKLLKLEPREYLNIDSVYPKEMIERHTAAPQKHKTKKGGGKKKVKVSPLLKSLMKRV